MHARRTDDLQCVAPVTGREFLPSYRCSAALLVVCVGIDRVCGAIVDGFASSTLIVRDPDLALALGHILVVVRQLEADGVDAPVASPCPLSAERDSVLTNDRNVGLCVSVTVVVLWLVATDPEHTSIDIIVTVTDFDDAVAKMDFDELVVGRPQLDHLRFGFGGVLVHDFERCNACDFSRRGILDGNLVLADLKRARDPLQLGVITCAFFVLHRELEPRIIEFFARDRARFAARPVFIRRLFFNANGINGAKARGSVRRRRTGHSEK